MALTEPTARTLADVRKAAVHAQYIAWCGAHHTSTNVPWENIYPWYTPAPGPNMPSVRNAGHFLQEDKGLKLAEVLVRFIARGTGAYP